MNNDHMLLQIKELAAANRREAVLACARRYAEKEETMCDQGQSADTGSLLYFLWPFFLRNRQKSKQSK